MTTAQLVRGARRGGGLTQRALAARAGIAQPALAAIERSAHDTRVESLHRLAGAAGYGLFLLPTVRSSAATWADFIYEELRSARHSEGVAFRALIGLSDDLEAVPGPLRVALCVAAPPLCGDARFDAAVAAIVEYHLTKDALPLPEWVGESSRVLSESWAVSPYTDLAEVPAAFQRHGVLLAESELASA
ncbi:MAG: helix-turn-helix transcriptional regulator [Acidimicrobiales bacterium]